MITRSEEKKRTMVALVSASIISVLVWLAVVIMNVR